MAIYVSDNPPPPGNYGRYQVYIDRGRTIGRVPNPLSGGRVKNAPEFANTRKYASLLAAASPLASAIHRTLPVNRTRAHYQQLAGKAIQWLKDGKTTEEVQLLLQEAADLMRITLKNQQIQEGIAERKKGRKRRKEWKRMGTVSVISLPVVHRSKPISLKKRRTGDNAGPPSLYSLFRSSINEPESFCLTRF